MKILVLSKYSRKGASSRYRVFQFFSALEKHDVQIVSKPLFNDEYLVKLYSHENRLWSVLKSYLRRGWTLLQRPKCDVVWVEKELFPWVPWFLENIFFRWLGKPMVVDYDDAIFHQYDKHRSRLVRSVLGRKCDEVMAHAQLVVGGNQYLASRARAAGARHVVQIPTVVSEKIFAPKLERHSIPVIGWIGSMSTAVYLEALRPVLKELRQKHAFIFRVVGAELTWDDFEVECVPWSEPTEVASVQSFDIGVMPLVDSPWERGKCGFKLIQYMACGKPVVADPVGVNAEIVEDGVNGFLVSENRSWYQALESLLVNESLRLEMGQQGRRRFQQHYSLEQWQEPLWQLFEGVREQQEHVQC